MLSAKIGEKSICKMRSMRLLAVVLVPVAALFIGGALSTGWAQPVCWWNIELNASDLDVGVRGFFDYDPWKELEIEHPGGRTFLEVEAESRKMKRQGLAEWFFESGEPTLFEVSFETFLRRFRPGFWEFEAELVGRGEVECEEELTHVIPCAPDIEAEPDSGIISIVWDPVTTVVDTQQTDENIADSGCEDLDECNEEVAENLLECGGPAPVITGYEVIVEDEDEKIFKIDVTASDTEMSVSIPPEFTEVGGCFQYEVLAIELNGNQTITEEEFYINEDGDFDDECPEV